MNANEIIAKSTKLGAITRTFKKSMETFSGDLKREVHTIEGAVLSVGGWEGELYDGFRERFTAELAELKQLCSRTDVIADKLERCAVQYDIIIEKLKKAST